MQIPADLPIVVQGITGREGSAVARESLAYGARVLAGVTPGRGGQRVEALPVYDTVHEAVQAHGVRASVIAVPPNAFLSAVWEATDAGIEIIVGMTERVPRHDVVRAIEIVNTRGARLVGPNSLGLIVPGKTRLGMVGGTALATQAAFKPGPVAILSRSGGMTTELASMLSQAGIGQSICVSLGGDPIVGTSYVDLMPFLVKDGTTRAVLIFAEPGTSMEEDLALHIRRSPASLPVVAFVAGKFVERMPGQRFGHAAAIVEGAFGRPSTKIRLLKEAGVIVAERLRDVPSLIQEVIR
jgi:succinyl-CoA synthetase alpha subunit